MPKRKQSIPESLQIEIAQFFLENEDYTQEGVAKKFNVSHNQVRYALKKYKRLQFDEAKADELETQLEIKRVKIAEEMKNKGAIRLINNLIVDLIAECEVKELPIGERVNNLNKLTTAMKRLQSLQLVETLKKPDAQKVIKLCKKIKPGLTDSEILVLWEQVITEK